MGAEPWSCFVPFEDDIASALESARRQEFAAGRYRMLDPDNPPATIEEACLDCDVDGTASVLDMTGVAERPHDVDAEDPEFCSVAPLSTRQLMELYGTERPTRRMVEQNLDFYDWIDRGLGIYVVVYDGDIPTEIFFAGYSFD